MNTNLKESLASWKTLNPRTPWLWPAMPRLFAMLCISLAVLGVGYVFLISPEQEALDNAEAKMGTLKKEYQEKYQLAANLEAYQKLRVETEKVLSDSLKQLPSKSEMESLLNDIYQAALGRGLGFDLFKPNAAQNTFEFYAELPITVRIEGTYHDLAEFSSAVARLSRIVTINDIELSILPPTAASAQAAKLQQAGPPAQRMLMTAVVKTFRYLDDSEMKEQQKIAVANKKAAGPK